MQRFLPLQIFVQGNLDSMSGVNKVSHQWPWFNPCPTLLEIFFDKFVNNMSFYGKKGINSVILSVIFMANDKTKNHENPLRNHQNKNNLKDGIGIFCERD